MILFENRASTILFNTLSSLDIKGKFLLPLNICPIVPITFLKANIPFELIDIELENLCIDRNKVLEKIKNENISGVLFAHTFGIELDMEDFFQEIKSLNSNIFIIDDKCLNIPTFDMDMKNTSADLVLFSTGYVKFVDLGWGGYGFLKDYHPYIQQELSFKADDLSTLTSTLESAIKLEKKFIYTDNNWLGSMENKYTKFEDYKQAIEEQIVIVKEHKEKLNKIYMENIPQEFHLGERFNTWRFSILSDKKDTILQEIFKHNLFASSHYKEVDYLFSDTIIHNSNANKISSQIVNLFNDLRFTQDMAFEVSKIVRKNL